MSDKQDGFITRLVHDRYKTLGADSLAEAMAGIPLAQMDKRQKSQLIDRLLDMTPDPLNGQPERLSEFSRVGRNDSAGQCESCGHQVEVKAGFFYGPHHTGSKWRVCHAEGKCSTEPAPTQIEVSEGVYSTSDGKVVLVYLTKNDRLGGKIWDGSKFSYVKGAITMAGYGYRMTAEEAAAFGKDTGQCVFCRRELSDDRSKSVGYGPTCASKNGLPWGEEVPA